MIIIAQILAFVGAVLGVTAVGAGVGLILCWWLERRRAVVRRALNAESLRD